MITAHSIKHIRSMFTGLFILCLVSGSTLAEDHADSHVIVKALNETWNSAFNSGDASAIARLYATDASLSPGNGTVVQGRDGIEALFQGYIDNGLHDHSIEVLNAHQSDDVLYQVSKWQARGVEQEDGSKPVYGGILVNILHRDNDGNWKSRVHVWNTSG